MSSVPPPPHSAHPENLCSILPPPANPALLQNRPHILFQSAAFPLGYTIHSAFLFCINPCRESLARTLPRRSSCRPLFYNSNCNQRKKTHAKARCLNPPQSIPEPAVPLELIPEADLVRNLTAALTQMAPRTALPS